MAFVHPKGKAYFQKLMNRLSGSTPEPRAKVEVVTPITRVNPIPATTHLEPQKKSRKRDKSGRHSHSSPRRHRHGADDSSQPLSESLFGPSMRLLESVSFNLSGPKTQVFHSTTIPSLAHATIELSIGLC